MTKRCVCLIFTHDLFYICVENLFLETSAALQCLDSPQQFLREVGKAVYRQPLVWYTGHDCVVCQGGKMQPKNLERAFYVCQESVLKFISGYFFFSPVLLDYVMLKGTCVFFYLPLLGN